MQKSNNRSMSITSQESYSAVMITDLVADVPVNPETEQGSDKPVKEETNLGYDGHLDGESRSPAADEVDPTSSHITNGGGITRGVILNAVQFGQPDLKSKSEEKNIQLTATLPVPTLTPQISEPKGFKEMSILRKIAFGVSFLPSILFVLCFSIILPCNPLKPCIEEVWGTTFNNTEPMSRLEVSQNVMFTALKDHQSVLINLYKDSGKEKKILAFDTNSAYLKCGNILKAGSRDCIVMDGEGKFYTINDNNATLVWNPISEDEIPTDPILLTDCNGDETEEIALAVSNTKIKIMYSVTTASSVNIPDCDSVPTKLTSWVVNGSSAIVFVCKKDGEDKLVKIPQNMWCPYSENPESEVLILNKEAADSLSNANILPVENGLVLWSEDKISMIQPNGSILWEFSDEFHSKNNRFILYGNFEGENKQVALLSSSISQFKMTVLDPSDGILKKPVNFTGFEVTDAVTVHTEAKDFILVLKKKTKQSTDILTTTLTQINDFTTTFVNLVANEEILGSAEVHQNASELRNTLQEVSFLDESGAPVLLKELTDLQRVRLATLQEVSFLDESGAPVLLKELTDLQNEEFKTTLTAAYDETNNVLKIYLLSSSDDNATVKTTKVRSIHIANWNKSKKSKCLGTD